MIVAYNTKLPTTFELQQVLCSDGKRKRKSSLPRFAIMHIDSKIVSSCFMSTWNDHGHAGQNMAETMA